jgi:uroporphyrinogen-III decarboxylase
MMHFASGTGIYTHTLCGRTLEEVGEDWTDAISDAMADLNVRICLSCGDLGAEILNRAAEESREDRRREIATEQGMMYGIDAYNDAMGYSLEEGA